ncbi:MAG: hypothetical protein ABIJ09_14105 [Pseudomonadota bacterium]
MPYCPECRSEYVRSVDRCAACDVALVEELPTAPPDTTLEGARLYIEARSPAVVTLGALEPCREIRDHLLGSGIPCLIQEYAEEAATDVPAMFQRYQVLIAEEDVERVREALVGRFRELLDNEGVQVDDAAVTVEQGAELTCPACGNVVTLSGDECPECGLFLGAG